MKAVLISIQPKWCEKIFNGQKMIEVRKSRPSIPTPFKVYVYCTKMPFDITDINDLSTDVVRKAADGRGKVIGELVCERVRAYIPFGLRGFELSPKWLEQMCLSKEQLDKYGGLKTLYGWHITDLKIYDKPKELGEFYDGRGRPIKRAFQSWGYCNGEEN